MAEPILRYVVSSHCAGQMRRRSITDTEVRSVLLDPEQRFGIRRGRDILQSRAWIQRKRYLIRVIVDIERDPAEVVSVYRTSKVAKYWRLER